MSPPALLIYGANGYTGSLCAERAVSLGARPILAGRSGDAVFELARRLGLPWRSFALEDETVLRREVAAVDAVLHCAGPFSATWTPMVQACLAGRTHYLDITGEIAVFEGVFGTHGVARAASVVLLPGVGFDVVPTDCLAVRLKDALPDAAELDLAFAGGAGMSPGTAKTLAEGMAQGLRARRDGVIVGLRAGSLRRTVVFADKAREVSAISWGDLSSAFRSTGIPNITCYTQLPPGAGAGIRAGEVAAKVLRGPVLRAVHRTVEKTVSGPTAPARRRARMQVWGQVRNQAGQQVCGTAELPDAYLFTARAAVDALLRVGQGEVPPGTTTPGLAFGGGYLEQFDDVTVRVPAD